MGGCCGTGGRNSGSSPKPYKPNLKEQGFVAPGGVGGRWPGGKIFYAIQINP